MIYCLIPVCIILYFKYKMLKYDYDYLIDRYNDLKKNDEQLTEDE